MFYKNCFKKHFIFIFNALINSKLLISKNIIGFTEILEVKSYSK